MGPDGRVDGEGAWVERQEPRQTLIVPQCRAAGLHATILTLRHSAYQAVRSGEAPHLFAVRRRLSRSAGIVRSRRLAPSRHNQQKAAGHPDADDTAGDK